MKRAGLKRNLSDYLGEDVVAYATRKRRVDRWTYEMIAADLRQSGYKVAATTVQTWVAQEARRIATSWP